MRRVAVFLRIALLGLGVGCAYKNMLPDPPGEPFLWDDNAEIVRVHRADIVEAEAAVVRYLRTIGRFSDRDCAFSVKAYDVFASETAEAYQVSIAYSPGSCNQTSSDVGLPPIVGEGLSEYAVRKGDMHIIRERLRGDATKPTEAAVKPTDGGVK